jgi:mannose-6-phosphate isomerase-like protein (cupin superfamily)
MKGRVITLPLAGRTLGPPDGSFLLAEWTADAGGEEPPRAIAPLHVHFEDDEAWYVLEGALRFRIGDEEVDAGAGAAVFAPRGVAHTYWNAAPEPARYLIVMTPNVYALIEELHATGVLDAVGTRRVFEKHASELLE